MTADTITCDELESALARLAEITRNRDNYYPDLARQIFEHIADRRKAPGSTLSPLGAPALPSAADIVRYMRATGWAHGRQGSHGAMWARGDVEFSVPHEDHNPAWLREVVARLASAEGRTPEATAAAIAEYRDARGSAASVGVPAVTSPVPAPVKPPAVSSKPPAPVSEAAVQAALDAVALFWKEAHAVLQAYPSAALARAMLEGAAPLIRADAEAKLAAQREYDTYRRALWVMVRQFGGSVFLTSGQMEDVPLLASLGVGREPGGIRIIAGEEL